MQNSGSIKERLEFIHSKIQPIIKKLKNGEELIIRPNHVTLKIRNQEYVKEINSKKKKSHAKRIHENLPLYIENLKRKGVTEILMSHIPIGNNWDKKFAYLCNILKDEKPNNRSNSDFLEIYFQLGKLLDEKGWSDEALNMLNLYFIDSRGKLISRIAEKTYLLFITW
ncbi:24893_t:CDS:1 [Dentiscutata erythropus]|uniref:24893_t:CDS:1 n=1 Tax=Dentiscutata erythropus TaxID=1348616 RepID=A0A9N9IA80_9GLOM|nr:24893_t:CDS:1 [Dentiscutata erythropus]